MEMTREEKEQTGKYVLQMARLLEDGCYQQEMLLKAVHIIDEALEQEPTINKIRAEIEQLPTKTRTNWDGCCPDIDYPEIEYVDVTKAKLLEIIDKYKAESDGV